MTPLTRKQMRTGWIVFAVLALAHFAPTMLGHLQRELASHESRTETTAKRGIAPVSPKVDTAPPAETGPAFPLAAQQRFLGIWDGMQMSNSNCQIHLELRPSPYKPGYIAGYETRICYDLAKFLTSPHPQGQLADAVKAKSPLATELEGVYSSGDLAFRVTNSIGGSEFTCTLSKYTVVPWGSQDVIAQWTASGGCPEGQMILKRGRG